MYKSTILFTVLTAIQTLSVKRLTPIKTFLPTDEELLKACVGKVVVDDLAERRQLNDLRLDLEDGKRLKCKDHRGRNQFTDYLAKGSFLDNNGIDSDLEILPGKLIDADTLVIKSGKHSPFHGRHGIVEIDLEKYRHGRGPKSNDNDSDKNDRDGAHDHRSRSNDDDKSGSHDHESNYNNKDKNDHSGKGSVESYNHQGKGSNDDEEYHHGKDSQGKEYVH